MSAVTGGGEEAVSGRLRSEISFSKERSTCPAVEALDGRFRDGFEACVTVYTVNSGKEMRNHLLIGLGISIFLSGFVYAALTLSVRGPGPILESSLVAGGLVALILLWHTGNTVLAVQVDKNGQVLVRKPFETVGLAASGIHTIEVVFERRSLSTSREEVKLKDAYRSVTIPEFSQLDDLLNTLTTVNPAIRFEEKIKSASSD